MKVIYLGRKPASCQGLKYLIDKNVDVSVVVAPDEKHMPQSHPRLVDIARYYGIPLATDEEIYNCIHRKNIPEYNFDVNNVDLVISFLYWKKIKPPLIKLPRIGCINFHPAPLPDYRGLGGYNFAIYERLNYWGVSAHFVDEEFDTGDIIKVYKFNINPDLHTAYSLEQKTQGFLLELFQDVMDNLIKGNPLPRIPQGKGRYISRKDFEELRKIKQGDTLDKIERKIRAFWYPPYNGASLRIKGKEFTLIDKNLLNEISKKYHNC